MSLLYIYFKKEFLSPSRSSSCAGKAKAINFSNFVREISQSAISQFNFCEKKVQSMAGKGKDISSGNGLHNEQRRQNTSISAGSGLNMQYPGDSTPLNLEGSLAVTGWMYDGGMGSGMPGIELPIEEEFMSSLAYHPYHNSSVSLNPHLLVHFKEDRRLGQRLHVRGSSSGSVDHVNTPDQEEEGSWSFFLQHSERRGKEPVCIEQLSEGENNIVLPPSKNASYPSYPQDDKKGGIGLTKPAARIPISWSSVADAFSPPILSCLSRWDSVLGITNQEAAEITNDPLYIQYLKAAAYTKYVLANYADFSLIKEDYTFADSVEVPRANTGLPQQQEQYEMLQLGKSAYMGSNYLPHPVVSHILSPARPDSHLTTSLGEQSMSLPSNMRSISGKVSGHSPSSSSAHFVRNLLEEVKNNKSKCFEIADIVGHVVEFSSDQFGSQFIQQKLERARTDEKYLVFREIKPYALSLMSDIFGNLVVQKFLEHGSAAQRRSLAYQIQGHVLQLSLHMYGCRVVQKVIEVTSMAQKMKLVYELDGHVMRCVQDKNGNHVIQKCITCIPHEKIHFIISSFYGRVARLSAHPYGCRVIERVLEHCDDPNIRFIVMEEIMKSVCSLAPDKYGNYVVQHVLEHGKPEERSCIIKKLAGQIVPMSLQKVASIVVEKCLTFGNHEDRQLLMDEIIGSTEKNEPFQALSKDQYGNYVVQKALEFCNDQQLNMILSQIKVNLNELKRNHFGKQIVARVENLVENGEKRIRMQSSQPVVDETGEI